MSHLAPQAAIFSPSVARAAASTAKDWAYVDGWLRRQFTSSSTSTSSSSKSTPPPPSFERNPETLEVLLALIAANEEADEERDRLARLEASALDEVRAVEAGRRQNSSSSSNNDGDHDSSQTPNGLLLAEDLLTALDAGLSKEGQTALDALADVSLSLDAATDPSPSNLSHRFVELQGRMHEAEHLLHRVGLLQSYLADESARLSAFLEELRTAPQYQLRDGEEKSAEELERAVKTMASRLPELTRHVEALEKRVGIPPLTVEDLRHDEEAYLDLLARKKDLDAQVKAFAGLPPDVEAARVELEGLRAQLREATERRDANFEMLVERESPVKVRTSRRF
ncbi:hypothetical protein FHL15_010535 [Xylaria flabelliformis]|uniref:Uncharacterized protein n=1 Tax=Xylaria flabelliformis TaxID=2512241 RepID=A0A553HKX0_9PEZI|nr:hypothetical protein FHL15_010535 [Xylaria flabelliformis]